MLRGREKRHDRWLPVHDVDLTPRKVWAASTMTQYSIRAENDVLTLRLSGWRRFLSLKSLDCLVTVDRYLEMVTIEARARAAVSVT